MAVKGTLRDFSLSDILQLIGMQRKSGLLEIKAAGDTSSMGFLEGRLVTARSAVIPLEMRLGEILLKSGRVTEEQLQTAVKVRNRSNRLIGSVLYELGYCSLEDLAIGLSTHYKGIVFNLFTLKEGEFLFDQDVQIDYEKEIVRPIEIEGLLMETANMLDEWPMILKIIRSTDLVFRPSSAAVSIKVEDDFDPYEEWPQFGKNDSEEIIGPKEALVYKTVDGRRSVKDILYRTLMTEFECYKAFYSLISRGLIEEVNSDWTERNAPGNLTLIKEISEKIKEAGSSLCLDAIQALSSVGGTTITLVAEFSNKRVLWPDPNTFDDSFITHVMALIQQLENISGRISSGSFEYVIDNIGCAFFWDSENDFLLVLSDALISKSSTSRFRSEVARVSRRISYANQN